MIVGTGLVIEEDLRKSVLFFDLDSSSFEDQVQHIRSTDILISPHGSGLINMIFLEKVVTY